MTKGQRKTTN